MSKRTAHTHMIRVMTALLLYLGLWAQPATSANTVGSDVTIKTAISTEVSTDVSTDASTDASTDVSAATKIDQAQVLPTPFRAVYEADYKGLPIRATAIRELQQSAANQFILSSTATSFFASVSEVSNLTLTVKNHLIPIEYQYHRKGIGKNRHTALRFDWPAQRVIDEIQSTPWAMTIPTGTLDKLSYQLQMRYELLTAYQRGQPWPTLAYQVVDGGELKTYRFEVLGEENVDTPIGRFSALKIARVRTDSDRTTIFWLAPAYEFLLVRFLQEEQSGGFELLLKEAKFRGKVIAGT